MQQFVSGNIICILSEAKDRETMRNRAADAELNFFPGKNTLIRVTMDGGHNLALVRWNRLVARGGRERQRGRFEHRDSGEAQSCLFQKFAARLFGHDANQ